MGHHEGMFKVSFVNADTGRPFSDDFMFLPAVPAVGERVEIRDDRSDWRPTAGTVTGRKWFLFNKDPEASYVDVLIGLDPKK